jgi:hypothetical protein
MTDRVPQPRINWQSLAEQRIREAQEAGQFTNLPGFGRPIPGIDEPYDELWWIKQKLKDEELSVLPPAFEIGRDVERTLAHIATLSTESQVRREVLALNARIRKGSLAATGPSVNILPLDVDQVVAEWRARRATR